METGEDSETGTSEEVYVARRPPTKKGNLKSSGKTCLQRLTKHGPRTKQITTEATRATQVAQKPPGKPQETRARRKNSDAKNIGT